MVDIKIEIEKCIRCAKCVKVCPSLVLAQHTAKEPITILNKGMCIGCGHCVMVCPESAVSHSLFSVDSVHQFDYAQYPTAEQMLTLIRARRSNRAFNGKAVPADALKSIVEAAYRAPTASNMQQVGFTVVTSPENLKIVSGFTIGVFGGLLKILTFPLLKPILRPFLKNLYVKYVPAFKRMQVDYADGGDLILRGASAVLLIHAPESSRFAAEDANLAYQNASLMAESLGVSQFYTGFVLTAVRKKKGELEKKLSIDGKIVAGMALGMSSVRYESYVDKEPVKVKYI